MSNTNLHTVPIQSDFDFLTEISYQCFGEPLGHAPICLVNHALTGNSNVCGENGWWNSLIGEGKPIDTRQYTVLAFNIPGNGFDGLYIDNYQHFDVPLIANYFLQALNQLNVKELHSIIGGSLGGAIGWQMLLQQPNLAKHFIPIGTDWKTTDWIHAFCQTQHQILTVAVNGVAEARKHAMMFYRTPQSFAHRFANQFSEEKGVRLSTDWLNYHGRALDIRFSKRAYFLMNHLLANIHTRPITKKTHEQLASIEATITMVAMDTDILFPAFEMLTTSERLKKHGKENVHYREIQSPHGHDAFLIEFEQLATILNPIFK